MIVVFGIGSNLADKEQHIQSALDYLSLIVGTRLSCSDFFYSEPWGFVSDNRFVNVVAAYRTNLSAVTVLWLSQRIERLMGRQEHSHIDSNGKKQYADRNIDIDLLFYFPQNKMPRTIDEAFIMSEKHNSAFLTLPHPLIRQRDFVVVPLRQIL